MQTGTGLLLEWRKLLCSLTHLDEKPPKGISAVSGIPGFRRHFGHSGLLKIFQAFRASEDIPGIAGLQAEGFCFFKNGR